MQLIFIKMLLKYINNDESKYIYYNNIADALFKN